MDQIVAPSTNSGPTRTTTGNSWNDPSPTCRAVALGKPEARRAGGQDSEARPEHGVGDMPSPLAGDFRNPDVAAVYRGVEFDPIGWLFRILVKVGRRDEIGVNR